jgi:hypothetical protein
VISVTPEHRDAILTEEEQASNIKVMILLRRLQERAAGARSLRWGTITA